MEVLKVVDILKLKRGDELVLYLGYSDYTYRYKYFSNFQGSLTQYLNDEVVHEQSRFEFKVKLGELWYSIEDGIVYGDFGKKLDKPVKIHEINPQSVLGMCSKPFYHSPVKSNLKAKL